MIIVLINFKNQVYSQKSGVFQSSVKKIMDNISAHKTEGNGLILKKNARFRAEAPWRNILDYLRLKGVKRSENKGFSQHAAASFRDVYKKIYNNHFHNNFHKDS